MKLIGELIEVIAGRAGLGNVREVGETLTKSSVQTDRIADAAGFALDVIGSDLLDYGQMIIDRMKNTTGQGDPTRGDVFGRGQSAFQQADITLQSAAPNDSWDGSAAHAYADQNGRQQLRSDAMADADHEVHKVIYRESAQITLRRRFLDDQSNFLANTSYVTFPLQFIPRYGGAIKMAVELAALQTALGESAYQLYQLHSEASQNAADLQQALGRYGAVADGTELPSADMSFGLPPPLPDGVAPTRWQGAGGVPSAPPAPPSGAGGAGAPSGAAPGGAPAPEPVIADAPALPGLALMPTPAPPPAAPATAPAMAPLRGMMNPLGGLFTGAAPAGQRAPATARTAASDAGAVDKAVDNKHRHGEDADKATEKKDEAVVVDAAAPADSHSERAPIRIEIDLDPDRPHAPVTVRLDPENPPGTPSRSNQVGERNS